MIARVIADVSLDRAFDYAIPPELNDVITLGSRVLVPFGRRQCYGFIIELVDHSDCPEKLKNIIAPCENRIKIPPNLLKLGAWMAEYYCCSCECAVRALLPAVVRDCRIAIKKANFYRVKDTASANKFVIDNGESKRAAGRVRILQFLLENVGNEIGFTRDELAEAVDDFSLSSLNTLQKSDLVTFDERPVADRINMSNVGTVASAPLIPSDEQKNALATFEKMLSGEEPRHVMLLHGVTNSGKTEVYLQAISRVLESGKSAIVLVPEIALTPQTVRRFRARFGNGISILHSGLTDGERFREWRRIDNGESRIAVGARSALFAPFKNLGLIIVDEEHESSYKQSEAPRYHARDVAVMRGKLEQAAVILGSATPAFESYYNAVTGRYVLQEMRQRIDSTKLPKFTVVDRRLGYEPGQSTFFSKMLVNGIKERLAHGEQVILFLNRRGFARQMMCEDCGYIAGCPDCSVSYTYHRRTQELSCYMCGRVEDAPEVCPQCGSREIRYSGVGTEKVEAAAKAIFPDAYIARMDSDTMRGLKSYEAALNSFKRGEIDILIGTQMIAKGLHFPNVTLVGIINADQGLLVPDFRAAERTFQLLTQVAGRAGRGDLPGEVIVQTFTPFNDTINYAVNGDYIGCFDNDMDIRKNMKYPPFTHLIVVHFRSEDENLCRSYATEFGNKLLQACHEEVELTPAMPSPVEKAKGKYRYLITLRGNKLKYLRQYLRNMVLHLCHPNGVEIFVDVDAQSLI